MLPDNFEEPSTADIEAMMSLSDAHARGETLRDQVAEALRAREQKGELITPRVQPPTPENLSKIYYKEQKTVVFQLAGPGLGHSIRTLDGKCAVRFLMCGKDLSSISPKIPGLNVQWIETHMPYPMSKSGSVEDDVFRTNRTNLMIRDFSAHREGVTREFSQRMATAKAETQVPMDQVNENATSGTAEDDNGGGSEDDVDANGSIASAPAPTNNLPHHAFFVVSFIPSIDHEGRVCHDEPLFAVFASTTTESQANAYALSISEELYTHIDLLVVEGGQWIYPHLLDSQKLDNLKCFYPGARRLQEIIDGVDLAKQTDKAELLAKIRA
jgi:hypothetical protein